MAAKYENESVFTESTLSLTLPLITEENSYFNTVASNDYNSASTVEDYARQWASSVSKRWFYSVSRGEVSGEL